MLNELEDARIPDPLAGVAAALAAEFFGVHSLAEIEGCVRMTHRQIASSATVSDYLPLLAHRAARDELRRTIP